MEIASMDILADLWLPWIKRGGIAAATAVAISAGYVKLRSSITGMTTAQRLETQIPQAMERALIVAEKLRWKAESELDRMMGSAAIREQLHDKGLTRDAKLALWERLRVDSLAAIVLAPYCEAWIMTAVAVRLSVTIVNHSDLIRSNAKASNPSAAEGSPQSPSNGVEGFMFNALSNLLNSLGTSPFDESTDLGVSLLESSLLSQLPGLFSSAKRAVLQHLPPTEFGVANTAVSVSEVVRRVKAACRQFENDVAWELLSVLPQQQAVPTAASKTSSRAQSPSEKRDDGEETGRSLERAEAEAAARAANGHSHSNYTNGAAPLDTVTVAGGARPSYPPATLERCDAVSSLAAEVAFSGSFVNLVLRHAHDILDPRIQSEAPVTTIIANSELEVPGFSNEGKTDATSSPSADGGATSVQNLAAFLSNAKTYSSETGKAAMLQITNQLLAAAQQLISHPLTEIPELTEHFCSELMKQSCL